MIDLIVIKDYYDHKDQINYLLLLMQFPSGREALLFRQLQNTTL